MDASFFIGVSVGLMLYPVGRGTKKVATVLVREFSHQLKGKNVTLNVSISVREQGDAPKQFKDGQDEGGQP
jgi:hypothetical protein